MIDPDGFFIKLYPTVWAELEFDEKNGAADLGLPEEDVRTMPSTEFFGRLAAVRTLRIVEAAISQVKKIREDRDRDFQRSHR